MAGSNNAVVLAGFRLRGGPIGAEAAIIDVSAASTVDGFAATRPAFVKYQAPAFHGQNITLHQPTACGRHFGKLSVHSFSFNRATWPDMIELDYLNGNRNLLEHACAEHPIIDKTGNKKKRGPMRPFERR